jgi:hypothetical protein
MPAKPRRECGIGRRPDINLAAAAALGGGMKEAMITFLILIVVPTLIILNRLENSRSRRKVSVDGFKMINGQIVFRRKS